MSSEPYNYPVFDMALEEPAFDAFPGHLRVGGRAPDAQLEDLETGESTALKPLWRRFAMVEFGSFT